MQSAELRQAFLQFFEDKSHTIVPSSPLIPADDPTLLFTNAGMVQFKDVFLGKEQRDYVRATTSQRCVRAGGKHNDLENVGYTARHHTFFEMLGNFSFGDYFKRDAIRFAWQFLTEVLKLPTEKLWVTVYKDDQEAADIWLKEMQVSSERFSYCGEADNFWAMGDTGPCGPCSEIFYDHGPEIPGGPPGSPDEDGDRYIEIWNLVFMQYNRDSNGKLEPLPKPSVDTGMGFERIAAVLQGVHSNYEIDLFQNLLTAAGKITGVKDFLTNNSLRVIADHIRACAFLLADGVRPSNEGRGYVLRRIIRRAVRHGHQLGVNTVFFYKLTAALVNEMGEAYPVLVESQSLIERILQQEEEQFRATLEQGLKVLALHLENLSDNVIPGDVVFKLYDTYGFPVDLTADIARERALKIDEAGFEQAMEAQRQQSRAASQFAVDDKTLAVEGATDFVGYQQATEQASVVALFVNEEPVVSISAGQSGVIVLDKTPFYAESGGQAGDSGVITSDSGSSCFQVKTTTKQNAVHIHHGRVESGQINIGQLVNTEIEQTQRQATRLNHSATHLLHAALKEVLGDHVVQKGSLVNQDKLRFDFSHFQGVSQEELTRLEQIVNEKVRENTEIKTDVMSMQQAMDSGAVALFGEKYGETVRVLSMASGYSVELCGGTHASRTGDIGVFKIVQEGAVAAGVRRIEAYTGQAAINYILGQGQTLIDLGSLLKTKPSQVTQKVLELQDNLKATEKALTQAKGKLASLAGNELVNKAQSIGDVKVLIASIGSADPKSLRDSIDQLKNKLGSSVICLAAVNGEKVNLAAGVSQDCIKRVHAGELVSHAASFVGGKGGGRADMALAGGSDVTKVEEALAAAQKWIHERLEVTAASE